MHRASDYWYLFKLAVKAVIFVVIFGTLGALLFGTPPGIPPPPANETELRARAEEILALMWKPDLTEEDGWRQDVSDPFVEKDATLRRIWGPWESAENQASWTAYDVAHAERIRAEIRDTVVRKGEFVDSQSGVVIHAADLKEARGKLQRVVSGRITVMRQQSKAYCAMLEDEWMSRERDRFSRRVSVDDRIYLAKLRKQQGECRYWKSQAMRAQGA